MNKSIQYGLMAGAGTILYFLLFMLIDLKLIFHPGVFWSSLAIYILFIIQNGLVLRKAYEASPPWKELVQQGFTIFLIANALFWMFYFFLLHFFPAISTASVEAEISFFKESIDWLGVEKTEAEINQAIQEIRNKGGQIKMGDLLYRYAQGGLGGFLLAAGIGFLIKRI
jgi:hypothetical protein